MERKTPKKQSSSDVEAMNGCELNSISLSIATCHITTVHRQTTNTHN